MFTHLPTDSRVNPNRSHGLVCSIFILVCEVNENGFSNASGSLFKAMLINSGFVGTEMWVLNFFEAFCFISDGTGLWRGSTATYFYTCPLAKADTRCIF